MKYKTKPFEIEAVQWQGQNKDELNRFVKLGYIRFLDDGLKVYDYLQETWVNANFGDYIIRGMKNEFYPCAAEVFEAKYEEVK